MTEHQEPGLTPDSDDPCTSEELRIFAEIFGPGAIPEAEAQEPAGDLPMTGSAAMRAVPARAEDEPETVPGEALQDVGDAALLHRHLLSKFPPSWVVNPSTPVHVSGRFLQQIAEQYGRPDPTTSSGNRLLPEVKYYVSGDVLREAYPTQEDGMRLITTGVMDGAPNQGMAQAAALDELGAGGACHSYALGPDYSQHIHFQEGPVLEAGPNGIGHEALLAVLIDRLEHFQAGPFPCEENANALKHCRAALSALHRRTTDRMSRGVCGQSLT